MIDRERDLRALRNRGECDAVGAIQPSHEPSRGFYRRSAAAGRNARAIDHNHDQASARVLRVRGVVRRRRRRWRLRSRRDADELRGDDGSPTAIDSQLEVLRDQIADWPAVRVDGADVHLHDVDRRCEALRRLSRGGRLDRKRECDAGSAPEGTHGANSTAIGHGW